MRFETSPCDLIAIFSPSSCEWSFKFLDKIIQINFPFTSYREYLDAEKNYDDE